MALCSEDGKTVQLVLSAAWYRHWGGKRTLEGDAWIDGVVYHSINIDNWNWEEQSGKDLFPVFHSERRDKSGMPLDRLYLYIEPEKNYVSLSITSWGVQSQSTSYYGPASTKEECELLRREWASYYNSH